MSNHSIVPRILIKPESEYQLFRHVHQTALDDTSVDSDEWSCCQRNLNYF